MHKFANTVLLVATFEFSVCAANAQVVKILTQNMDAGTNESYILAYADTQPKLGVDLTFTEIVASNIPQRAKLLASRIAAEKPDIVGLQEATVWRVGITPASANFVLYDQVQLLLNALNARGVSYEVAAISNLTDIALPATIGAVRITDRDALLIRSDARFSNVQVTNAQTHIFSAALPFEGTEVTSGWISAEVQVNGKQFRLVSTHLLSSIPGVPLATSIQVAQAAELIDSLKNMTEPVVLSGDFNSDADFGNGPDATPSAALLEAAGYVDDWKVINPTDPGATWPLFLQDQTPPRFFAVSTPSERIDLFLSKGVSPVSEERIFAPAPSGLPGFGSDHAGVLATFRP